MVRRRRRRRRGGGMIGYVGVGRARIGVEIIRFVFFLWQLEVLLPWLAMLNCGTLQAGRTNPFE
jgi:hypothetical protein